MTHTDSVLVVVSQGEINRTQSAMKNAIRRAENAEAQLAEAKLEIQRLHAKEANSVPDWMELRRELTEAQAEIARLTPAAEAYRACVRWENASSYGTQEECASAWTEYLAATRRAIAFIPGATL